MTTIPMLDALPPRLERIGMVARWKPVHLGHAAVIEGLCAHAAQVVLGIGSSNRYDLRNPFTPAETRDMLMAVIGARPGVEIVEVPDLGDPPRWAAMVAERFGPLDVYVTANPWVAGCMAPWYPLIHPVHFVPPERRVPVDGTMVRVELARGEPWWELVPEAVAAYIVDKGLDRRFRAEFGAETLAWLAAQQAAEE